MSWNTAYLVLVAAALSLATAGVGRLIGKSIIKGQFNVRALLCLMTLVALVVVLLGAGLKWSPR